MAARTKSQEIPTGVLEPPFPRKEYERLLPHLKKTSLPQADLLQPRRPH